MTKKKFSKAKKKSTKAGGFPNIKDARLSGPDTARDADIDSEAESGRESDDPLENRIRFLLNQLSKYTKDAPDEADRVSLGAKNRDNANAKANKKAKGKAEGKAKASQRQNRDTIDSLKAYQLKLSVCGLKPPSWFRLLIPADSTFSDLDGEIRSALGWSNDHLHDFSFKAPNDKVCSIALAKRGMESDYEESTTRLHEIFELPVKKIRYSYNFSSYLELNIMLEKVLDNEFLPFPKIIKKVGRFPDEGGEFEEYEDDFDEDYDREEVEERK
jgi:hypothetical protein